MRGSVCGGACSSRLCVSVWERRFGFWYRGAGNRREKPETTKKAPETGAFGVEPVFMALFQGAPKLLLFLRSSFLLRGGFLGCGLHRLILPNIKFCDLKNRNVIHI